MPKIEKAPVEDRESTESTAPVAEASAEAAADAASEAGDRLRALLPEKGAMVTVTKIGSPEAPFKGVVSRLEDRSEFSVTAPSKNPDDVKFFNIYEPTEATATEGGTFIKTPKGVFKIERLAA